MDIIINIERLSPDLATSLSFSLASSAERLSDLDYDPPLNMDAYMNHCHPRWYLYRLFLRVPGLMALALDDRRLHLPASDLLTRLVADPSAATALLMNPAVRFADVLTALPALSVP